MERSEAEIRLDEARKWATPSDSPIMKQRIAELEAVLQSAPPDPIEIFIHWLRTSDEARTAPAGEIADKLLEVVRGK